jgi:hypothetical protein
MFSRKLFSRGIFALSILLSFSAIADPKPTAGGRDPISFGGKMVFLGLGVANVITDETCVFAPQDAPSPDTRCMVLQPAPAQSIGDFQDIGSIYIPGGSAKSILWPTLTYNIDYQFSNTTGSPQRGIYRLDTFITIESDVLKDPALIDPATGLPYNGKKGGAFASHLIDRTLAVGERIRERTRFSGVGIEAFDTPGAFADLPEKVIKKLFEGPITIRYGLRLRLQNVDFASVIFGLRITGDQH